MAPDRRLIDEHWPHFGALVDTLEALPREVAIGGTGSVDPVHVEKIVDRKLEEHARRQEREERMEWS